MLRRAAAAAAPRLRARGFASYAVRELSGPKGGRVATIALDDGKMNSFSVAGIAEVNAALDQAERDLQQGKGNGALVIRGNAKCFSAGFDLEVMMSGDGARVSGLVRAGAELAMRVYAFPRPVVAAATGHALAQGAILLLAADYRVGWQPTEGKAPKVGLNETEIGVPLPQYGVELARARMPPPLFTLSVAQATLYTPRTAIPVGFIDEAVDGASSAAAAERAEQWAEGAAVRLRHPAFAQVKLTERSAIIRTVMAGMDDSMVEMGKAAEALAPKK